MNSKAVVILGTLAAVGVVGAIVVTRSGSPERAVIGETAKRGAFLPDVAKRANDVARITITRATETITITGTDGNWQVSEKGDYPARIESVRAVVLGLAELREIEPKTSRLEQFPKLGVQDPSPSAPGTDADVPQSTLVTLADKDAKPIASVIIGNPKPGMSPETYVRRAGENQSWLVAGRVEIPRDAAGWMDTKVADIKRERVKSVSVTHPDGKLVRVSRAQQSDAMALESIPAGKELKDAGAPDSISGALTGLMFQDVAALTKLDPAAPTGDDKSGPRIEVRTFDGLVISIQSATHLGRSWWRLSASVDEAVLATLPPSQPAPAEGEQPDAAKPAAMTQDGLRAEAAKLNASWGKHAFAPSDWKVRTLNTTMDELVRDPQPATPASNQPPSQGLPPGIMLPPQG